MPLEGPGHGFSDSQGLTKEPHLMHRGAYTRRTEIASQDSAKAVLERYAPCTSPSNRPWTSAVPDQKTARWLRVRRRRSQTQAEVAFVSDCYARIMRKTAASLLVPVASEQSRQEFTASREM